MGCGVSTSKYTLTTLTSFTHNSNTAVKTNTQQHIEHLETPPENVKHWIQHIKGTDCIQRVNHEREHHTILTWLTLALVQVHRSNTLKTYVKQLLSTSDFSTNLMYMQIFQPLQSFCRKELANGGRPLQELYQQRNYHQLGAFLTHQPQHNNLRQDHALVGLSHSPATMPMSDFTGESTYLHVLRLTAAALNKTFQATVEQLVTPLGGTHKECAIKGDARMRNKALSPDEDRNKSKPRPALNLDILRCGVTCETLDALKNSANALVAALTLGSVENGFALTEEQAAAQCMPHHRCITMNVIVDFNCAYGDLCQRKEVRAKWDTYLNAPPENPTQPWSQWKREAAAAVDYLTSAAMTLKPVKMVCEIQLLLRPYLQQKKQMHVLCQIVQATTSQQLHGHFAKAVVASKDATFTSEELRAVEEMSASSTKCALSQACTTGFLAPVLAALKAVPGTDVNQEDNKGRTPLHIACRVGSREVVQLLLRREDVQVNQVNHQQETPLFIACQKGHFLTVQVLLLHEKMQVNRSKKSNGDTSLFQACKWGHVDVVQALLTADDIKVNQATLAGTTPLAIACQNNYLDIVQIVLKEEETLINQADNDGAIPLYVACLNGRVEVVQVLLANDALVNQATHQGATPLYIACQKGHLDVLAVLLQKNGIQVNQADNTIGTPLYAACCAGQLEVVRVLLKHENMKVNQPRKNGATPLYIACQKGHLDVVKALLDVAKENQARKDGRTPLFVACQNGQLEVVQVLLTRVNIQVNQYDNNGITPLYIACQKGHLDVVGALLAHDDIDVNLADGEGVTPLIIATYLGYDKVVKLLLANKNIAPYAEKTAVQYAESGMKVESWGFLDAAINEQGRVICLNLFHLKKCGNIVVDYAPTATELRGKAELEALEAAAEVAAKTAAKLMEEDNRSIGLYL